MSVREPAIDKGRTPSWDFARGERILTFEFRVELWLKGHGLYHLLTVFPTGPETSVHDKVLAVVCFQLPAQDLEYVRVHTTLCDIWAALRAKYMPSKEAEVRSLWDRFSRATLRGARAKQVEEYCTLIMSLVNQLTALGAAPAPYQVSNKLFEPLGREYVSLRSEQGGKDFLTQIAAITNHAQALEACGPAHGGGIAGRGHGQGHGYRGGNGNRGQPAAVAAIANGETRTCHVCKKTGHLQKDCPDLHPEVRKYLQNQAANNASRQGRGAGRGRGRGRGSGNSVAVVRFPSDDFSMTDVAHLGESLNFLVDSGSDVHVIRNPELFLSMHSASVECIHPIGDEDIPVLGEGTICFRLGSYVTMDGEIKDLTIEIPNCLYVPHCPFNILSTHLLKNVGITLQTRVATEGGDLVFVPGFSDQAMGHTEGRITQSHDHRNRPVFVVTTDVGKPVLWGSRVSNPAVWSAANSVAKLENDEVSYSRVAALVGSPNVPGQEKLNTTFLSHVSFLTGVTNLRLMAKAKMYQGLRIDPAKVSDEIDKCHGCMIARNGTGSSSQHGETVTHSCATYPGACLHADVLGPITPMGVGKAKYALIVVDEFSRFRFTIPMDAKSRVPELLVEIIEHCNSTVVPGQVVIKKGQPPVPGRVRFLRGDRGGEFLGHVFQAYLRDKHIVWEDCAPGNHQGNGIAERECGATSDRLRALMCPTNITRRAWPEGMLCGTAAANLVPSSAVMNRLKRKHLADKLERLLTNLGRYRNATGRDINTVQSGGVHKTTADISAVKPSKETIERVKQQIDQAKENELLRKEWIDNDLADVIPYMLFYKETYDSERVKLMIAQMLPWGLPVYVYLDSDKLRRLDPRGELVLWMGPGQGPHMNRVFQRCPGGGRVLEVRQMAYSAAMLRDHLRTLDTVTRGNVPLVPMGPEEELTFGPDLEKCVMSGAPPFPDLDLIESRKEHMRMHGAATFDFDGFAIGRQLGELHDSDFIQLAPAQHMEDTPELRDLREELQIGRSIAPRVGEPDGPVELQGRTRMSTPEVVEGVHDVVRTKVLGQTAVRYPPQSGEMYANRDTLNYSNVHNFRDLSGAQIDMRPVTRSRAQQGRTRESRSPARAPRSNAPQTDEVSVMDGVEEQHPPPTAAAGAAAPPRGDATDVGGPSLDMPGFGQAMASRLGPGEELMFSSGGGFVPRGEVSPPSSPVAGESMQPAKEISLHDDDAADAHGQEAQSGPVRQKWNPLVRRRLIPHADVAAIDAVACDDEHSDVSEQTVAPKVAGSSSMAATADSALLDAEVAEHVEHGGGQSSRRRPSRRVAAVMKKKPADPDNPPWRAALAGPDREKWMVALEEEVNSLSEHGTYELVDLPVGAKAISGKWVMKIKRGPTGEIQRYKARYVARGFTQEEGVDFFETWAPVGSYATLRVVLSIAAVEDLEMKHVDIQCAFLNGVMNETVYVEQPQVLNDGTSRVWKLLKTLYGLKQAAREWHKALARLLGEMGFVRSHSDPALYVRKTGRCFIFLWVDDLFIFGRSMGLKELIDQILKVFTGRDLGDLSWALGASIKRDRKKRTITLSQEQKIVNLLEKFSMADCRPSPTPLVPRQQLRSAKDYPDLEVATQAEHAQFMSAVGGIQYLAVVTRPDTSYACNALAKHMGCSLKEHWSAVQHVLRYLQSTKGLCMVFKGSSEKSCLLEGYTDADFANDKSLKSISGLLLRVYGNTVFWRSKRQAITTGDTTEAELIAMSSAANELMWAKQLLLDLHLRPEKTVLWGDNKSANILANNPISSDRSKHIRVRHLRVREFVEADEIQVQWVGTKDQLADVFTKVLPGPALKDVREKLHLIQDQKTF